MKYEVGIKLVAVKELGCIKKGEVITISGILNQNYYLENRGAGSEEWLENPSNFKPEKIDNWQEVFEK